MSFKNEKPLVENEHYSFVLVEDDKTVLFRWKYLEGLSVELFQKAISEFAGLCNDQKPAHAVIDASSLDQGSPAMAWLRGQNADNNLQAYMEWWLQEIVPTYNDAGITSLAVGTGDPNAPGELDEVPTGVDFKIGYFPDLESALQWKAA